jgi:C-terminal peptidase prc
MIINKTLQKPAKNRLIFYTSILITVFIISTASFAQSFSGTERSQAKDMLNSVKNEIKAKYYDKTYHGINLDERFKLAEEKLGKATTMGQSFGIIAQAVLELNDSHTTFYPPARTSRIEYGWQMQMIGDKCFVTAVKPKSEAEKVGLKIGDEILKVEAFKPSRNDLWKINYYYNWLSPRAGLNLLIKSPNDKEPKELNVPAKVTQLKATLTVDDIFNDYQTNIDRTIENKFLKVGNTVVWKMPTFSIDPVNIGIIMDGKVRASGNLILDLRGNGGGYVVTLEELAGYFVNKDTKIADLKGRKEMKPQMAKTKGKNVYKGNLIVLVDSKSASASEIFARFIQLEQRGVVLGDDSAGAVMQSSQVSMEMGVDSLLLYAMSMTNADVIMTDGKSLEHTGVAPQIKLIPSPESLAMQRDPVLTAAFKLFEQDVAPEVTGAFSQYKWQDY